MTPSRANSGSLFHLSTLQRVQAKWAQREQRTRSYPPPCGEGGARSAPGGGKPSDKMEETSSPKGWPHPAELREKLEPAEIYHELLEHRWFLSEQAGRDVGLKAAIPSYVEKVLRPAPDEKLPLGQ